MIASAERTVPHRGGSIWIRRVGDDRARIPVVCVPGGPGLAHDYLIPLERLAASGRPIVFYDPLGAGRSPAAKNTTWSLDGLRDELEVVREAIGVERIHVLAHSAGGFAAIEYALAYPDRVASLVLSSTPISMPTYQVRVLRLLEALGPELAGAFVRGEHDLRARDPEYLRAYYEYVQRHICRFADQREFMQRCGAGFNQSIHRALKGGLLLYTTGPLGTWDVTERLPEIRVPVLVTSGAFDVIEPAVASETARLVARGEAVVFPRSSHSQHAEEPGQFADAVASFLERSEHAP